MVIARIARGPIARDSVNFRAHQWDPSFMFLHSPSKLPRDCGREIRESCERRPERRRPKGKTQEEATAKNGEKGRGRIELFFSGLRQRRGAPLFLLGANCADACVRNAAWELSAKQISVLQEPRLNGRYGEVWMEETTRTREYASRMNEITGQWSLKPSSRELEKLTNCVRRIA